MYYNTGIQVRAPVTGRQQALAGLQAPFATPGSGGDVYAGLAQRNAVEYDRSTQMQEADYIQRARDTQQQMAIRGLEQMARQQQNMQNLQTQRQGMTMGFLNNLLSGLFT